MIYLHPYDLDADCPRLPGGGIFNRLRYLGIDSAWRRLETILRKFRFVQPASASRAATVPAHLSTSDRNKTGRDATPRLKDQRGWRPARR